MKKGQARRRRGEGSVFQRHGKGRWTATLTIGGRTYYRYAATQGEACRKLGQLKYEIDEDIFIDPDRSTTAAWINRWLNEYARPRIRNSSYTVYKDRAKHVIEDNIGRILLQKLRYDHIQAFINAKARTPGISGSHVHKIYEVLRMALEQAKADGLIKFNPSDKRSLPKAKKAESRFLTQEESIRLLIAAADHPMVAAFHVLKVTGVRVGEMLGMFWLDINWDEKLIRFCRTVAYIPGRGVEPSRLELHDLKNVDEDADQKYKEIPVEDNVLQLLKAHRKRQQEDRMRLGNPRNYNPKGLVFCRPSTGELYAVTDFEKKFQSVAKRAGLIDISPHALRHSFTKELLKGGVDLRTVMELVGDRDPKVVLSIYAHTDLATKRAAIKALQDR